MDQDDMMAAPAEPDARNPALMAAIDPMNAGIVRERPNPSPQRAALVNTWLDKIRRAERHHEPYFRKMREDQDFVIGRQWPEDQSNEKYVVNICDRHMQQRTASIYAKNPRIIARVRPQMDYVLGDGTAQSVQMAIQAMAMSSQTGMMPDPTMQMIIQEHQQAEALRVQRDRFSKTLETTYDYCLDEQPIPFKKGMKLTVRRAVINGVGYVKLGFVRMMQPKPETTAQLNNLAQRMAFLSRLAEDIGENEVSAESAEMEQLRLQIQMLQNEPEIVGREGLDIDYPRSTAILVDPQCQNLATFMGADWVAQKYILSSERIEEIYGIDIGETYTQYRTDQRGEIRAWDITSGDWADSKLKYAAVYEIWSKRDGQVFVVCDGYPEFLMEPAAPDVWTERFWPFFPLVLNETEHEKELFPPSDIRLIRHQQMEINRARQGLREHRVANRPKTACAAGVLDDEDKEKLASHPPNALIEINGLAPGQKIEDLLQPFKLPGIDPNLYETSTIFDDILHTVGMQEANLGGTSDSTATESSIAESSRMSSLASVMDDMDDLLTQFARAAGQILMAEMSEQTVKEICGPGAVWPQLTRAELAREITLEIEAGSSGRPNKAQEIQNAQQLYPLLMQIPGIDPMFLAKDLLRRMDDRLDIDAAIQDGLPSIASMNQMSRPSAAAPEDNPDAQGGEGAMNAETPQEGQDMSQETYPAPEEAQMGMSPVA